jgi:hypothetical protein
LSSATLEVIVQAASTRAIISLTGGVTDRPSCCLKRVPPYHIMGGSKLAAHEQAGLLIGAVPDSPSRSQAVVHSTGPVLLSGVGFKGLRHDGVRKARPSSLTARARREHRDRRGLAVPLVLG